MGCAPVSALIGCCALVPSTTVGGYPHGIPLPVGAVAGLSGPSVGALPRPRHCRFCPAASRAGVDRFFPQPVACVLINTQQHGRVSMAHDLRHRFHVRAMLQGFRGHGMAQAVGRYAPRDARRLAGLVPRMAYASHRPSLPVDDPRTGQLFVFLSPLPQQGQDVVPDGDDPAVVLRALGRIRASLM